MFAPKNVPLARIQVYKRGHLSLLIGIGRPFICRQRDKKGITEVLDLNCAHQALILTPCLIKNLFERWEWPQESTGKQCRGNVWCQVQKNTPMKNLSGSTLDYPILCLEEFPSFSPFRADSPFFLGGDVERRGRSRRQAVAPGDGG